MSKYPLVSAIEKSQDTTAWLLELDDEIRGIRRNVDEAISHCKNNNFGEVERCLANASTRCKKLLSLKEEPKKTDG